LEQLTYVILDITRIESQSLKLEIATQPQRYIILNTVEDYSDELAGNGVNSLYWPDRQTEEDIYVQADRERMMQVGSTLLGSALKFTESGTVTITTQRNSDNIVVTVQNTSTGI
jgi:signal transduction histidine kinase